MNTQKMVARTRFVHAARLFPPHRARCMSSSSMVLYEIDGKGRALVAEGEIAASTTLLRCVPIAKVLKSASEEPSTVPQ